MNLPPLPIPAIHAPFLKEVRTVHQGDYYTADQIQAQALEPVAAVFNGHYQQRAELEDGIVHNLYLHPAPLATGDRADLVKELRLLKFHVGGSIGDIVKRAAAMLEADGKALQVVPVGYVLVPIDPTPEMIAAAEEVEDLYKRGTPDTWAKVYRAMIQEV